MHEPGGTRSNSSSSLRAARRESRGRRAACTAWNMNSGMRASRTPKANWVTSELLVLVGEQVAATGRRSAAPPARRCRRQQPSEVLCDLAPRRPGPGSVPSCPRGAEVSRRRAVRVRRRTRTAPAAVMPIAASSRQSGDPDDAVGAHDHGVAAEPAGARHRRRGRGGRGRRRRTPWRAPRASTSRRRSSSS
jgi:hypothetical protein